MVALFGDWRTGLKQAYPELHITESSLTQLLNFQESSNLLKWGEGAFYTSQKAPSPHFNKLLLSWKFRSCACCTVEMTWLRWFACLLAVSSLLLLSFSVGPAASYPKAGSAKKCNFRCPNGGKPNRNPDYEPSKNGCGAYGTPLRKGRFRLLDSAQHSIFRYQSNH